MPRGEQGTSSGAFGIGQAIREGEARRGTQLSTRSHAGNPAGQGQGVPLSSQPAYADLPVYVGTLGNRPIRLRIGPKPDTRDSFHGEYGFEDGRGVRLLSGEYVDGALLMEESADGTHVTGQWEGRIDPYGAIQGQWFDVSNPSRGLPFAIRPVGVMVIPPVGMVPGDAGSGVTYAPPPPRSSILDGKPDKGGKPAGTTQSR
nr:hypothetical protein [Cupriavidus sp. AU9028]